MVSPSEAMAAVLALGDELLRLMQEPVTDEQLDQLERALDQREAALQSVAALVAGEGPEALRPFVEQQRVLEGRVKQHLEQISQAMGTAARQSGSLRGVRQLLQTGVPARYLSERR